MPFVSGHHRCDDGAINHTDQEQLWLDGQLARDILVRVVPGAGEAALFPERHYGRFIGTLEGANLHPAIDGKGRSFPPGWNVGRC